jgi:hypothetical protein
MLIADQEEAAVFDVYSRDRSVQHVVAFSGDRADRRGEMSAIREHLLSPADFATNPLNQ